MRKTVTTIAVVLVFGGAAFGWWLLQNQPASAPKSKTTQAASKSKKPSNPNEHSYMDVDFARKMIVHNQQGVQMEMGMALAQKKHVVIAHEKVDQLAYFNQAVVALGQADEVILPITSDPFAN